LKNISLKTLLINNSYLLATAAWLITISFIIDNYWSDKSSDAAVKKRIESYVQKQEEDYDKEFKTVQIEAKFPGGAGAWQKYLERNLNAQTPSDNGAPPGNYTVIVSFLVDKSGNISEVQAVNDPGYGCAQEAVRVIRKGPAWTPAVQNGRNVIYRQKQSVTFQVSEG